MATPNLLLVGTAYPLGPHVDDLLGRDADVVILPTAAAFTGMAEAAIAIAGLLEHQRPEALLIGDRDAAQTEHFARRIREAAAVVLTDGSPLHFRTAIRDTVVHDALRHAHLIVSVGSMGTVLGATMVDPRGGAPTTGLGIFDDCVVAVSSPTLARTRELLRVADIVREVDLTTGWSCVDGEWLEI